MSIYLNVASPASKEAGQLASSYGLENHGLTNLRCVYWNLSTPALYEEAIYRSEASMCHGGPLLVNTGKHTARAAADKFIVKEDTSEDRIWWGKYNRPFSSANFGELLTRLQGFLQGRDVFVQDCLAGADPDHSLPIRIITHQAWHSLFARTMFLKVHSHDALKKHIPEFTVIAVPAFHASPLSDGTRTETFIVINFRERMAIIGGTSYAGEIKKSIFTVLNYLLPLEGILPMHCSANVSDAGETAIFFGLSGTGKTTLSADPRRHLIGDDEHGWSDSGVFNFEDGCYAKVIRLSEEAEPQIYACTRMFGTVLENVIFDRISRHIDLNDMTLTENTRAAYPLEFIANHLPEKRAGHPKNVVFLTCDASGVMPPIARLTADQAVYHFIAGYTSKIAGTEVGVGTEPQITFSACFGGPFMVHNPLAYADLLKAKILNHRSTVWLVNTGWTGGAFGIGRRISIQHTRALLDAALSGQLDKVDFHPDPVFGFEVPKTCPNVPPGILDPANTWSSREEYYRKYDGLAARFIEHFKVLLAEGCPEHVSAAGPKRLHAIPTR
jgi:phosphoenolpyruvate carboxykinase (ATP)